MLTERQRAAIRLLAVPAVAALCAFASVWPAAGAAAALVVVLGQGHFLLTYRFHARSGRINSRYIGVLIAAVGLSSALYGLVEDRTLIAGIVVCYFALHFVLDELFLMGHKAGPATVALGCPVLMLIVGEFACRYWHAMDAAAWTGIALWLWMLAIVVYLAVLVRVPALRRPAFYFLVLTMVCGMIIHLNRNQPLALGALSNFVVILHVVNWYIRFLPGGPASRPLTPHFWTEVCVINVLLLALVMSYHLLSWQGWPLADALFSIEYFYFWTLIHFAVTFRPTDFTWVGKGIGGGRHA